MKDVAEVNYKIHHKIGRTELVGYVIQNAALDEELVLLVRGRGAGPELLNRFKVHLVGLYRLVQ